MTDINRPADTEEIATVIGKSKRTIERMAKKPPGWKFTEGDGAGRHKKQWYALKELPQDIQFAVLRKRRTENLNNYIETTEQHHAEFNTTSTQLNPGISGGAVSNRTKSELVPVALDVADDGGRENLLDGRPQSTSARDRTELGAGKCSATGTGLSQIGRVGRPVEPDRKGLVSNKSVDGGIALRNTNRDLSEYTADQRDIHLAIQVIMAWLTSHGNKTKALRELNQAYVEGDLSDVLVSALSRCKQKASGSAKTGDILTASTVTNWVARFKEQGNYCPNIRQKDMTIKSWHVDLKQRLDNNWQSCCYSLIHEELVKTYPDLGYNAMTNWIRDKYSRMDVLKGRHRGMALRAKQSYQPRNSDGMLPWDEVHADGWNTHFTAPHPRTGEFVTYELWDFHDVATRYIPPFGVGLTENFEVIARALEHAIRDQGVMCILQTDSTKIIKQNKKFTGDPVKSISDKAGITIVHPKTVGNAQANGIAENWHAWADKQCRVLATYQAKNQDSLTHRNVKKITAQMVKAADKGELELRDKLKARAEKIGAGHVFGSYEEALHWMEINLRQKWNNKPHSSLKKLRDPNTGKIRHQSPQECLDEFKANGWMPVMMDEAILADLFMAHVELKVKRGMVSPYGGMLFRAEELDAYEGDKVVVAYDYMDYSQVIVKDLKGELICVAPFKESTGYHVTGQEAATMKRGEAQAKNALKKVATIEKRTGITLGERVIEGEVLERVPVIFREKEEELIPVPVIPREKEEPLKSLIIEGNFNKQEPEKEPMTNEETILYIAGLKALKNKGG
jgi:transposase